MAVWQVEIYDNRDDPTSTKRGFVEAPSETEAIDLVTNAMGGALRADMSPVAKKLPTIPNGVVLWENL
jgi:hypothetical protein